MKKGQVLTTLHSLWVEFAVAGALVLAFAALGYFAREFAVDLQASFFALGSDWGFI